MIWLLHIHRVEDYSNILLRFKAIKEINLIEDILAKISEYSLKKIKKEMIGQIIECNLHKMFHRNLHIGFLIVKMLEYHHQHL